MAVSLLSPERTELSLVCVVGTPQTQKPIARGILGEAVTHLEQPGLAMTTTILVGATATQINALAIEGGHDLIVMSTTGHDDDRRSSEASPTRWFAPRSTGPGDPAALDGDAVRSGSAARTSTKRRPLTPLSSRPDLHLHVVRAQAAVRVRPKRTSVGGSIARAGFPSAGEGMAQER